MKELEIQFQIEGGNVNWNYEEIKKQILDSKLAHVDCKTGQAAYFLKGKCNEYHAYSAQIKAVKERVVHEYMQSIQSFTDQADNLLHMIGQQQDFPMLLYDANGIGVILGYLWKEIPFIIYFVLALMANINGSLGEAAVNLGATGYQAFFKVTLPLCANTILSGFLIVFVFALGAYELPFLLGATKPKALPILAYIEYSKPDLLARPYAMAINGIIIAISVVAAVAYYILIRRSARKLAG